MGLQPCILEVIVRVVEHARATCSEMPLRKGANSVACRRQPIAPGRRKIPGNIERVERLDGARRHLCGRGVTEEIAKECEQAADDGRLGIAAKIAATIAHLRDEPHHGHAAPDAVRVDAIFVGEKRNIFGGCRSV